MEPARALSDMQQAMLVQELLEARPMYTMPLCFHIQGELDVDALERALHVVMRRHPALHSVYEGCVATALDADAPLPGLEHICLDPTRHDAAAALSEFWAQPFDVAKVPPLRAIVVSTSAVDHHLGVVVHHLAGDSWSLAMLAQETSTAYAALIRGSAPEFAAPAPDFFDFAELEANQDVDISWWARHLSGATAAAGLTPPRRAEDREERGAFISVELKLDADDTRAVRRLVRDCRVSAAVVLLSAVSVGVSGDAMDRDTVVGLLVALRDTAERQQTMGPLLNTLPIRTMWPATLPARAVIERHAEAVAQALDHKDVPYPQILRAADGHGSRSVRSLFLHLVNVDSEVPRLRLPGLRAAYVPVAPRWANFPAVWEFAWGSVGNIRGTLRVSSDHFTRSDALALRAVFRQTLIRLAAALD